MHTSVHNCPSDGTLTFSTTLGKRKEHNPYSGELAAIAKVLSILPRLRFRSIALITRNKGAVLALERPRQ